MSSQVPDPYWAGAIEFIQSTLGNDPVLIAPREFLSCFPRTMAYDFICEGSNLTSYQAVAVHKGLLHELPVQILHELRERWICGYGNEVFLVFLPADSPFPVIARDHLEAFDEKLEFLDRKEQARISHPNKITQCLILASRRPEHLEILLRSLSLMHLTSVVVPLAAGEDFLEKYRSLCTHYRACLRTPDGNSLKSMDDAMRFGLGQLIENTDSDWIATFDDGGMARPDFLGVMEKWRDMETRPLLGGFWEPADGIVREFYHDGFYCVIPKHANRRFLYGHRTHWIKHMESFAGPSQQFMRRRGHSLPSSSAPLVIPGLIIRQEAVRGKAEETHRV